MSRLTVTNYQTGLKYSFREHGLRSRLIAAIAAFVVGFGSAIAVVASPVDAAGAPIFVSVCGNNSTWYVNPDEGGADPKQGDRRPLATNDGLVFTNNDLIHHQVNFTITSATVAGTYVANPAPSQTTFFSMEVWNTTGPANYGTIRWDSAANVWSVTTGGNTTTGTDPAALLTGLGLSTTAQSFGVGYTNNPPGTVTTLVSSISFQGTTYALNCAGPTATVTVAVPGPTVVVTKDNTVYVQVPAPPAPTTPSPSPTAVATSAAPVTYVTDTPPVVFPSTTPVADSGSGVPLWAIALLVALALFLVLLITGIVKAVKNRRQTAVYEDEYQGAHHVGSDRTQVIPVVRDSTEYHPTLPVDFDPRGGWAGENYPLGHDGYGPEPDATIQTPTVSEEPTSSTDTKLIPPGTGS